MTRAYAALRIALPHSIEDEIVAALHGLGTIGIEIVEGAWPAGRAPDRLPEPLPASGPLRGAIARTPGNERAAGDAPGGSSRRAGSPDGRPAAGPIAIAYFDRAADLAAVGAAIASIAGGLVLGAEAIAEEPWVERQQAARRPIEVGERFLIVPEEVPRAGGAGPRRAARGKRDIRRPKRSGPSRGSGAATAAPLEDACSMPSSGGRIVLLIPIGRAFGTGEHETTRLCLEQIERAPVADRIVLDLGTGSGVLAMAAARLGARRVVGLDNDPEAAEIAAENARGNGFDMACGPVAVVAGELASIAGPFDLIVANLFPGALEQARADLAARQAHGGVLVLSGFSPAEGDEISRVFAGAGYRERERRALGEWAALVMERILTA